MSTNAFSMVAKFCSPSGVHLVRDTESNVTAFDIVNGNSVRNPSTLSPLIISELVNFPIWPSSILCIIVITIFSVFSKSIPFGNSSSKTSLIKSLSVKRLSNFSDQIFGRGLEGMDDSGPGLPIPTSNIL